MGEGEQILQHHQGVGAVGVHGGQQLQTLGQAAGHHRLEKIVDLRAIGEAQHGPHLIGADRFVRHRHGLIQNRQPVARRTIGGAGDQGQHLVLNGDLLGGRDGA